MLLPQNERFVRDFLTFSCFVTPKSTFSCEFSHEAQNFLYVACEASHLTKYHACRGICMLSPLDAALTIRFAKARNTTRLKCCACHQTDDGGLQSAARATKNATHLLKTMRKYCAYRPKRLSTRYQTCWNVTTCHACHAKRS